MTDDRHPSRDENPYAYFPEGPADARETVRVDVDGERPGLRIAGRIVLGAFLVAILALSVAMIGAGAVGLGMASSPPRIVR